MNRAGLVPYVLLLIACAGCAPALQPLEHRAVPATAAQAPDHRYEGIAIGGAIGFALGALLGLAYCSDTGGCVIGAALGAGAIGAFTGLMIGGLFPKDNEEDEKAADAENE